MIYAQFYNNVWSNTHFNSILIEGILEIEQDLKGFDEARFETFYEIGIEEYNKVRFVDENNNMIFEGWIFEIEPYFDKNGLMLITLRGRKALFYDRASLVPYNVTNTPVQTLLQSMISAYSAYGDNRTLQSDIANNVTIETRVGDLYFNILDELADQCNCYRDIEGGVVKFLSLLGTDKSAGGPNYQEIIFDGNMATANNVTEIKVKRTAKRANIVIGIDNAGNKNVQTNLNGYVYGVAIENFSNGDLPTKTTQLLSKKDVNQVTYNITVENNSIKANKGDKVMLNIYGTTPIFNIQSPVVIMKKKITYDKAELREEVNVSDLNITETTFKDIIGGIKRSIEIMRT